MTRTVLRAGTHGGPLLADTRSWTVRAVSGGGLVSRSADGDTVVARPGEIARVVLVPGEQLSGRMAGRWGRGRRGDDVVSFLGDDRVLLTIPVRRLHLGRPHGDPEVMRATSGVAEVAQSVGAPLEPATPDDVARVRAEPDALTHGPAHDALLRRRRAHLLLIAWLVAAVVARVVVDPDSTAAAAVVDALLLIPLIALMVDVWRLADSFLRRPPADPDGRAVVPNVAPADQWAWLRGAQLQIGADEIVMTQHGLESWLPGPRQGGVVQCAVSPDAVWFLDRRRTVLAVVPALPWTGRRGDTGALDRACREAGIEVEHRREADLPAVAAADLDPTVYASFNALHFLVPQHDRGVLLFGTTVLLAVAGFFIGATSMAVQVDRGVQVVDMVAGVAGLAVVVAAAALGWRTRSWNRRQMATGDQTKEMA